MSKASFEQYTVDYISGVMSLRTPQKESLLRLEKILGSVQLSKTNNFFEALTKVNALYPTCTSFEREFMSMTFALATGVGKTRLMGAFIAYLYTQKDIHNFFVVAPNTNIYMKLINDLSNPANPKYVFKGLSCFVEAPNVVTGEDYSEKPLFDADINIYIFNIDKFNKEGSKMRSISEQLGESFYGKLAGLNDLVLIMDESHHYRAERGAAALDDLKPVMGLELTATPVVTKGSKQTLFKNVVYEYPLSQAIADGYTRTPFAMAQVGVDSYNFGDEQLDKLMLHDGIVRHENYKKQLEAYAKNHGKQVVKPFAMIVCKDTTHATWVQQYVTSSDFFEGKYLNKTLMVHSKQKGVESESNMKLLLDVERPENPIEIVIHVNMLKEGWDVNNLYTIIPLRTAASKVLREQMVGRGLRLPYGERTGDTDIDSVMLTAHDKFKDIIAEAKKGDSIFKAGNIIQVKQEEEVHVIYTQTVLNMGQNTDLDNAYAQTGLQKSSEMDAVFTKTEKKVNEAVNDAITATGTSELSAETKNKIVEQVAKVMEEDKDLGDIFRENEQNLFSWIDTTVIDVHKAAANKYIPIPRIKITEKGVEECNFVDFDIDLSDFNHVPTKNSIIIQNLEDLSDRKFINGEFINFEAYNPGHEILKLLRMKPEVDYESNSELIQKLIVSVLTLYKSKYGEEGMKNVVMMNKRSITEKIYTQMMKHFFSTNGLMEEEVVGCNDHNIRTYITAKKLLNIYDDYGEGENIRSLAFNGIKYGVFAEAAFDSRPELEFARLLEYSAVAGIVKNWLRPAPQEFNITYNRGKHYEPDFIVETEDTIYMVEIKGENMLNDPDVLAKKDRGIKYCRTVSDWGKANGYKQWRYLFIPAQQVKATVTFELLADMFCESSV